MSEPSPDQIFLKDQAAARAFGDDILGEPLVSSSVASPDTAPVLSTPDAVVPASSPDGAGDVQMSTRVGDGRGGGRKRRGATLRSNSLPAAPASTTPVAAPAAAPATQEAAVVASTPSATLSEEDQMAAEWAAALDEMTEQYENIEVGQVWEKVLSDGARTTKHIMSISPSGYVSINENEYRADGSVAGMRAGAGIDVASVEKLRQLLKDGGYQLSDGAVPKAETGPDWTLDRLLAEVPEGEFTLQNSSGTPRFYRRQGDQFFNRSGKSVPVDDVLDKLKSGRWHIMDVGQVGAPNPGSQNERGTDTLKGRDPKNYDELFEGDEWVLLDSDGKERERIVVNLFVSLDYAKASSRSTVNINDSTRAMPRRGGADEDMLHRRGDIEMDLSELRRRLQEKGFVLSKAGAGRSEKSDPRSTTGSFESELPIEAGRDPLKDMREGDVWVLRDPSGKIVSRRVIDFFVEIKPGQWNVDYDETVIERDLGRELSIEAFRQELVSKGYQCAGRVETNPDGFRTGLPKLPQNGQIALYQTPGGAVRVLGRLAGGVMLYEVTNVADGTQIGVLDEDQLFARMQGEAWKAEVIKPQSESFELPQAGEEKLYTAADGSRFKLMWAAAGSLVLIALFADGKEGPPRNVTEDEVRELAERNKWQLESSPEAPKPREAMTRDNMQEQIDELKAKVAEARGEFVRIEAEQAGKVNWLLKTFRTLSGKESVIAPELQAAREAYKATLAELQSAEIERFKLKDLKGDESRKEIARIVREYDFLEAEQLDDDRRALRMGAAAVPLKEKWKQMLEGAKRSENIYTPSEGYSEVTGQKEWYSKWALLRGGTKFVGTAIARGTKAVGEGYNSITKTRTGKITTMAVGAAGAATLAFATGGAALSLAGVALAAKRAAAGAGVALVAEEGMAAYARRRRDLKSQELGEDVATELLSAAKREAVEAYANNTDLTQPQPSGEVVLSEKQLQELEQFLKSQTLDQFEKRDSKRRRGALWRKSGAIFAGVTIGSGAFGQVVGMGAQEAAAQVRDSGAIDRVARAVEQAASGVGAANAAEAAASASSGVASAVETGARPPLAPGELPNALNQDRLAGVTPPAAPSGLDTGKLEGLLGERKIERGETIWKYATEAGKTAGLSDVDQAKFASLVRTAINEKLANMPPEAARAAGFLPNPDGKLTADFIRADDKLNLSKVLSAEDMQRIMQAVADGTTGESGTAKVVEKMVTAATEVASGPPSGTGFDTVMEATAQAAKEGLGTPAAQAVVTSTETVADGKADFMKVLNLETKSATVEYIQRLPVEQQAEIYQSMKRTVRDLFDTEYSSLHSDKYDAQFDFREHSEFAQLSMQRVLADHEAFKVKFLHIPDQAVNPLHITQIQEIGKLHDAAAKVYGKSAVAPFRQESIQEYVLRLSAIARGAGKAIPGLRMVN